jgi:CDP-glucose 4,6-dehydratase
MFNSFYKNKRVLLTGHTGFKGSWLAEWLLMLGAEVHTYALPPQPHQILFQQLNLESRLASNTFGDITDQAKLTAKIQEIRPEVILHLAAQPLVRLSFEIPVETMNTNIMGTAHLLEAVRLTDSQCTVLCITTDKCYENREWLYSYREEDPMGGYDPYSASKGAAELVISSFRRSYFSKCTPIRLASARAGNVIGGGDWSWDRIVPDCVRALRKGEAIPVRNKTATRPWQHVLEPLSGYLWLAASLAAADNENSELSKQSIELKNTLEFKDAETPFAKPTTKFQTKIPVAALASGFNFGPNLSSNRTVAELVHELLEHTGGEWQDHSDPNAHHEASKLNLAIDKAFHLLQWQPVWNFKDTIAATAKWYLSESHGHSPKDLTTQQIQEYHQAASAQELPWAM